jgi:hypothetical protein
VFCFWGSFFDVTSLRGMAPPHEMVSYAAGNSLPFPLSSNQAQTDDYERLQQALARKKPIRGRNPSIHV